MNDHPNDGLLILALDEELEKDQAEEVGAHLGGCAVCKARQVRFERVSRMIAGRGMRTSPHPTGRVWVAMGIAAAVALCLIVPSRPAPPPREQATEFMALPFSDAALPLDNAPVVRMEFPVESLRLAKINVEGDVAGRTVTADVLLGLDGQPRAIRFVR